MDSKFGKKWSEDEITLAFYYYCKTPVDQLRQKNPEIIRLASILGRTPDSLVLKLWNLLSLDPEQQKRNVSGMNNASKTDALIVRKYLENWNELANKAVKIETELTSMKEDSYLEQGTQQGPLGGSTLRYSKTRINQKFFREAILASYHVSCCITGISVPELLIASHIKPWAESNPDEQTDPHNGLCLNALHDKAFDKGLITVLPDYTVCVSSEIKSPIYSDSLSWLLRCDKEKILIPDKFPPKREFLQYHNDVIFIP